jgi:dolichyl-diphosphooligosaccharide---protein glycosyltransferase
MYLGTQLVLWLVCRCHLLGSNRSGPVNIWALSVCSISCIQFALLLIACAGVFGLLQIVAFAELVRSHVSSKQFQTLLYASVIGIGILGTAGIVGLTYKGWIAPWTGRFYSLWDTGYAKKYAFFVLSSDFDELTLSRYIPIIASVSEHQPTAWPSFFMDLHFLIFLFPAGVVMCFKELRDEHVFVIIYAAVASYFAGVMVRLMLTLTPCVCVAAAIAFSSLLDTYIDPTEPEVPKEEADATAADSAVGGDASTTPKKVKKAAAAPSTPSAIISKFFGDDKKPHGIFGLNTRFAVLLNALGMLVFFVLHCTWVTSNAYSSPSVVLASTNPDGSQHIIDDFREAYYWLRQNTAEDAVVMSWWDYGYQIAGMADRPTLVDNNTWNNSELPRHS